MTTLDLTTILQTGGLTDRLRLLTDRGFDGPVDLDVLLQQAEELVHDRPADSWVLAELCTAAAVSPDVRARGAYLLARIAAERGQLERALTLIEQSRRDWMAAGDSLKSLRTDLGRMHVLDDLGRHREAIEVGDQLAAALEEVDLTPDAPDEAGAVEWLRATTHNNLGVAHSLLGDHVRASEEYRRAEAAYRAGGLADEAAKTQANRGIELLILGQAREALDVLLGAQRMFETAGDRLWAAKCAGHIAQAHRHLGDVIAALRILRDALDTLVELEAEAEAARLRATIADVHLSAGLYEEARTESGRAAEVFASLGMVHDQAMATFTEAVAALESRALPAAGSLLDRAAALFADVGDRHYAARVHQMRAELASRAGQQAYARREAEEAAAGLTEGGWPLSLAWTRLHQADLAADGTARDDHLAAAADLVGSLRLPALELALVLRQARRQRELGEPDRARVSLERAVRVAECVGATLTSFEIRPAFRADHAAVYDELVDLLTGSDVITASAQDRSTAALLASYRSKAVTLSDVLQGSIGRRSLRRQPSGADLDRVRGDLSAVYHAMSRADNPALTAQLSAAAAELEQELTLQQLDTDLTRTDEKQTGARRPQRRRPSDPQPPVLAYHVLADDLVIFLDTGDRVELRRVRNVRPELDLLLDRLASHWTRFAIGPEFIGRHRELMMRTAVDLLGRLHGLLVAPIADLLEPLEQAGDELIVVPHRRLQQVPFAALYDGSRFLLHRWSVIIAPTATSAPPVPLPVGPAPMLIVAVPDEMAASISSELVELQVAHPHARVLLGASATTTALRDAVPGPQHVHLACHGLFRASNPMFSALRLHDRWLTAAELTEYDFGGALVTVGACETGRTELGAEPVGLSWALLVAGAAGVVVSHWLVDDHATAQLMPALYRELEAGHSAPQALRQAQLSWLAGEPRVASGAHPFYWAAFSYVAVHGDHRIGVPA